MTKIIKYTTPVIYQIKLKTIIFNSQIKGTFGQTFTKRIDSSWPLQNVRIGKKD